MKQLAFLWVSIVQTTLRMFPFSCETGLVEIGRPARDSPVVLTGNFRLTVERVKRALEGPTVRRKTRWTVVWGPVEAAAWAFPISLLGAALVFFDFGPRGAPPVAWICFLVAVAGYTALAGDFSRIPVLPPATIRRFKLNLIGKRLVQTSDDDGVEAGGSP